MRMARLGVYFDTDAARKRWNEGANTFEYYLKQILDYTGIPYEWIGNTDQLSECDILLVALDPIDKSKNDRLWDYVNEGGILVSYGGLNAFAERLESEGNEISVGYARDLINHSDIPLRFLKAVTWSIKQQRSTGYKEYGKICIEAPGESISGTAFQQFDVGKGEIHRWAVDIPFTVVGIQQGTNPVLKDGMPAPDGSANIDDDLLKADDGFELDWEHDRKVTETGEKYFAHPFADLWKEILISHILQTALQKGMTLPFVDYWPDGVEQVLLISHDSDINLDESADLTLEVLKECGIRSTWCMMEPGYSNSLYKRIHKEGHEIAFHYNAMDIDNGYWGEEEFSRQLNWLKTATGLSEITSNKNHYTRYENWGDLFKWCEKYGIQSDQTRGPSKKGNIGFLFGTCHPYFPIARADEENRFYDVVEISFLTQDVDLNRLADTSIVKPFLSGVRSVRGIAHFLFHQIHLYRQESVRRAIKMVVEESSKMDYECWTGEQINRWIRLKKQMKVLGMQEGGTVKVINPIDQAVVCIPVKQDGVSDSSLVKRFGVWCEKQVLAEKIFISPDKI